MLGRSRATPLDFWWGPMSGWLALALGVIVAGGFTILWRLKLLRVALGFWATFAVGIGVLALSGHAMTAHWHLGPITGFHFWLVLVTSPEVLVFLFFMITDPKTAPRSPTQRLVYAVSLGLLASLLIAPTTTEYASKVALLASLADRVPGRRRCCAAGPSAVDRRLALVAIAGRARRVRRHDRLLAHQAGTSHSARCRPARCRRSRSCRRPACRPSSISTRRS